MASPTSTTFQSTDSLHKYITYDFSDNSVITLYGNIPSTTGDVGDYYYPAAVYNIFSVQRHQRFRAAAMGTWRAAVTAA
jgi:hypothetical protein